MTHGLSSPRHHSDHSGTHPPLISTFRHIHLTLLTSLMDVNLLIIALKVTRLILCGTDEYVNPSHKL